MRPGAASTEALAPQQDVAALEAEFALIREAMDYLRGGLGAGIRLAGRSGDWLPRLAVPASVLSSARFARSRFADGHGCRRCGRHSRERAPKYPRLSERAAALADFRHLSTAIRRAVLPNGEISDDASPQLKRIRAGMGQAREKIQRSLESILRARGEPAGEDYITLRNDRFVIPVRASDRRAVPGVVHGASATGQTVFVEPLEAIDLNNRLVQLREEETAEIARILAELTDRAARRSRAARGGGRVDRAFRFDFCARRDSRASSIA